MNKTPGVCDNLERFAQANLIEEPMKLLRAATLTVALSVAVQGQGIDYAKIEILTEKMGPNLYMLSGSAHAGSFALQGQVVTIKLAPGVNALIAGKPATTAELQPDTADNPTVVELGNLRFHAIIRGERVGIRLKDLDSDAARQFRGAQFFPLDLSYRVTASFLPSDGKQTVEVPNVLGDVSPTPIAGTAVFKINGQELKLTDLGGDAAQGLFFVFSDPTSKTDTYPGGRFLKTGPVTNGTVVLDFNRAYNPPCAVTPYATCPLAPKENRLSVAIPAGEEYDHKHGHH